MLLDVVLVSIVGTDVKIDKRLSGENKSQLDQPFIGSYCLTCVWKTNKQIYEFDFSFTLYLGSFRGDFRLDKYVLKLLLLKTGINGTVFYFGTFFKWKLIVSSVKY